MNPVPDLAQFWFHNSTAAPLPTGIPLCFTVVSEAEALTAADASSATNYRLTGTTALTRSSRK